jgi:8-oxo-dGTP diphosphatase
MLDKIKAYVKTLQKEVIPQLSVNCVIFGFHEKSLKLIVNKIDLESGTPLVVLPGGYVGQREDLSAAVVRIVKESTGLENILFRQFDVFGDASRSFGKEFASHPKLMAGDQTLFDWVAKRHVTICYLALVDFNKIELKPTQFLESAEWLPINKAKTLAMDHADIVRSARESLLMELPYSPVESNLLPKKFTLPELHSLMEAILGRHIDRPNFRRKALKSNVLIKVGQDGSQGRRPADLYTFKHGKKTSLNEEYRFGF